MVSLLVALPSTEMVEVEAMPGEKLTTVKEKVASLAGLCMDTFVVTFEGEEIGGNDDGRSVGELPFEDNSTLQVTLDKKNEARKRLKSLGWKNKSLNEVVNHINKPYQQLGPLDRRLKDVLEAMADTGECDRNNAVLQDILLLASRKCLPQCLKVVLVRTSADVNKSSQDRGSYYNSTATALHVAANKEIASILLDHNADVSAKNGAGQSPLYCAMRDGRMEVAKLLLLNRSDVNSVEDKAGNRLLHLVANISKAHVVLLLQNHVDVNASNSAGESPLHRNGNFSIAELLIASGADVNTKDHNGDTPLHTVKCVEIAELLLKHGAEVEATNNEGRTPLHSAVLKSGANVHARDDIAAILLRSGANVHARDAKGNTALHLTHSLSLAFMLHDNGAESDVKNYDGRTTGYSWGMEK